MSAPRPPTPARTVETELVLLRVPAPAPFAQWQEPQPHDGSFPVAIPACGRRFRPTPTCVSVVWRSRREPNDQGIVPVIWSEPIGDQTIVATDYFVYLFDAEGCQLRCACVPEALLSPGNDAVRRAWILRTSEQAVATLTHTRRAHLRLVRPVAR